MEDKQEEPKRERRVTVWEDTTMKFYLRNNFLRLSMKPITDSQFLDKIISFTNPKTNETS